MRKLISILIIILSGVFIMPASAVAAESLPGYNKTAEVKAQVPATAVSPDIPVIRKTSSAKGSVTVYFNAKNADRYLVYTSSNRDTGYVYKGITKSKSFKFNKLGNKHREFYIKIRSGRADGTSVLYSDFSASTKAVVYKYKKAIASAEMFSKSKFASKKLADIKKGKRVKIIGKDGRWYKIRYKGKEGYVYNKTFEKVVNLKKESVNEHNYKIYLDDWIFKNSRSISAAYNYVSRTHNYRAIVKFQKYKSAAAMYKHQDEMAVHAIKNYRTSCKGYSSLLKSILERQGHKTYYVFAHKTKYNGCHVWCAVKTKKGYRHIDSRRRFYLLKESQLSGNSHSRDLKCREKNYPRCA